MNNNLTGSQSTVERMGDAAAHFLASLAQDQRRTAQFAFDDEEERTSWHYTPIPRHGLPFSAMERRQQRLAHQLLATGLSRAGYTTAATIMGLESVLDMREEWERPDPGRDPLLYYVSIFGSPDPVQPWGWRFEGHHISLHYTIVGGRIVSPTPTFFGSNPAEAQLSPATLLRPLGGVEDLARELVHGLSEEQRSQAVLAGVAPADIVMTNRAGVVAPVAPERREDRQQNFTAEDAEAVSYTAEPQGLDATAMSAAQRELLAALIYEYLGRLPDEIAEIERERLPAGFESVHFAWAGSLERGQGHYYRLQSPRFLVEYDNTQNDANHIHSVWRDPGNDFGADILAQHYAVAH